MVGEYLAALGDQDLDRAIACWKPGGVDHLHQQLGLLPGQGTAGERAMTAAFKVRTAAAGALRKLGNSARG